MKLKTRGMGTQNRSTAFGIAVGVGTSLAVSLLLSIGLTSLLVNGAIAEGVANGFVIAIRLVAVLLGSLVGSGIVKENCLLSVGLITLGNIVTWLGLGVVIYDGTFKNLGAGIVSIIIGGIVGYIIRLKLQIRPQRTRRIKR